VKTEFVYPAIFEEEVEGGYVVEIPDLPGCVTGGNTLEEAFSMARDAIGIYLSVLEDEKKAAPVASDPAKFYAEGKGFVALVDVDMLSYKQRHNKRAVKKTLSIPQWLNTMAEREGINFSNVLQKALRERLHV